ncbi:MAG TPA: CDP-glucose 4,6-dehydratase [Pseudomonadales bacterium]|nr:CDP-glucose 4,6-dehydratase [Pseudomonadales bacterium]
MTSPGAGGSARRPSADFWKGRRVLVTGDTGFKGSWTSIWLHDLGAEVRGLGLPPETDPSLFLAAGVEGLIDHVDCDVRDHEALRRVIVDWQPEIILHLAAQALVRRSYREPRATFDVNAQGTVNVLDVARELPCLKVLVAVTTDKVYENLEHEFPYRETDRLGGRDPYAASKAMAELAVAAYRESFLREAGVAVATARAGNVIGGGDWSEDRLVPDAVRAWLGGSALNIRNPGAVRPWQHVLEPVGGYLALAEQLSARPELADAYNFGPTPEDAAPVREVIAIAADSFPSARTEYPQLENQPHEASLLALDNARARSVLGVRPCWRLDETVRRTMEWYRVHAEGRSALELCRDDIAAFGQS